jgi:hypothetical protein
MMRQYEDDDKGPQVINRYIVSGYLFRGSGHGWHTPLYAWVSPHSTPHIMEFIGGRAFARPVGWCGLFLLGCWAEDIDAESLEELRLAVKADTAARSLSEAMMICRTAASAQQGNGEPRPKVRFALDNGAWRNVRRVRGQLARRSYCRRTGRFSGPRKPNPCQRTLAGSGKVMLGKRSNSMGSRMTPTVRRDSCAPAQ